MVMKIVIRDRNTGEVTFDSSQEYVMFGADERYIDGKAVGYGAGIQIAYPNLAGRRIQAFLASPSNIGELFAYNILSCRVSYPNAVPTVSIFVDNVRTDIPNADGRLIVTDAGVSL